MEKFKRSIVNVSFRFPTPFLTHIASIAILISGLSLASFSQSPIHGKETTSRIDSIFRQAEAANLNTSGMLRYTFSFTDVRKDFLEDFAMRLTLDSMEAIGIVSKGKEWQLHVMQNAVHSRESIQRLEKKLRWIKFKFLIDDYDGFTIGPADIDALAVPAELFLPFVKELDNEDLFSVSERLLHQKSYTRALVALSEGLERKYKLDTTHYHYGTALIATDEYEKGIHQWEQAVNVNPNYLDVFLDLGSILYDNSHFRQALTNYKKADALQPNNDQILYLIAETLYQMKRYNEAHVYAKRSVKLNRDNVFAKGLVKMLKRPHVRKQMKENPLS